MTIMRKSIYGTMIGIIVLDTGFRRLPGDIAHTATWPFPVQFHILRGVSPKDVIEGDPHQSLYVFRTAIDDLVASGCTAITTSCGFLAALQKDLVQYSPVPFLSSALLQIPMIERILPAGKKPGLIVSDIKALTKRHLDGIGVTQGLPVAALPINGPLLTNMRNHNVDIDAGAQERDVITTVEYLLSRHPEVGALIFECANLPPYSALIARQFSLPVFDIVTLVQWMQLSVAPPVYAK